MPNLEDWVLVELHRAAELAGRPGIAVPSLDLGDADERTGSRDRTRNAISRLIKAGKVTSVRKDLIVLPDATGRVRVDISELVDVIAPTPYLITGGRALQRRGLTDQHFFVLAVLVPTRVSPIHYRGERASFFATDPKHIWGWEDAVRPQFATAERVIVDVLGDSRFGVSFSQALTALRVSVRQDRTMIDRLHDTVRRFESDAIARRVGYLVYRCFGPGVAAPFRDLIGTSRTSVPLRRGGNTEGPVDPTWRIIVNASTEPEGRDQ